MKLAQWAAALTCGAALIGGFYALRPTKPPVAESASVLHHQEDGGETEHSVPIGGDFQLIDEEGRPCTNHDFPGQFLIVYFGYTYCPDICPMGLRTFAQAMNLLSQQEAAKIQPLFITVDPDRDTPQELKTFVQQFFPRLKGLTGAESDVRAAAEAYKVYYKLNREGTDGEHYLVDHSSIFYIMSPTGEYCGHFTHASNAPSMVESIRHAMNRVKSK